MAIQYEIEVDGDLLSARATGAPENVEELKRYGAALVSAGIEAECTKALLDEREMVHSLNEGDLYFLAEQYSTSVPRLVRAAIVFSREYQQNVGFWETCAVNRGLRLRAFMSRDTAVAWLNSDFAEGRA